MSDESSMLALEFDDCDAYFDAINDVDVRFTLQGLETSIWRISSMAFPRGVNVQHCWSGSGSLAQGVSQRGGFELAVPASGQYTANGRSVPVESTLLMVPDSEFLVSIPGKHSWYGVFVPDSLAVPIGLAEHAGGRIRKRTQILDNATRGRLSVPTLMARFFANLSAAPAVAGHPEALARFEAELLATLGAAYGHLPEPKRSRSGRPAVVDRISVMRALDAIEASPEHTIAMSKLVQATNVSERSLRAGFRRYLGMSPTRYMQLRVLNRARNRLATSGPGDTTVAEVATDLGIWDLGRFASRYRTVFGELPSHTLRRTA
jgi:AraC-like DNA-binding protein